MSKRLMLMHLHIVVPKHPHVLNVRNNASINNVMAVVTPIFKGAGGLAW